jgi:hypothetical protein
MCSTEIPVAVEGDNPLLTVPASASGALDYCGLLSKLKSTSASAVGKRAVRGTEPFRIADIVGFEGLYAITDTGLVLRLYRTWKGHSDYCNMRPTRFLVCPKDAKGRRQVRLFAPDGRYRRCKVYHLVAEHFVAPYHGEVVNHKDGDPSNDHWTNLEWTTTAGNLMHGQLRKANHRLTAEEITEVRKIYKTVPVATIANRFNIDKSTIHRIVYGKDGARGKRRAMVL